MGSCISSQYSHPAIDPLKLIPNLSSSSLKRKKKRKAAADAAEYNAGTSNRRPTVSGECAEEEQLQQVHGRMFKNGASEVASLYTQQGKKGTNQDAMLIWENFASRNDTIFCGVFDGHGPYGHLVSKKVRDSLPLKLCSHWENNISAHSRNGSIDSQDTTVSSIIDTEDVDGAVIDKPPEIYYILRQSFLKAFKLMDKELKLSTTINCFCSGSTAVTIVKQGNDLVIGNVGDSRAILGTRDDDNTLVAEQLTVDLKPNLPREAERIQQCNGRVFALQDEPEVARVWLPNNDSPGLAMARAFGDFCLKDYGLISVPDISYRCISEKDEFVVLASDGIWDALSNKEVVDIVASAPTRGTAARALVDSAVRSWRLKYPTSKIDDCAAICLFLEPTQIDSYELPKINTDADEVNTSQTQIPCTNNGTNIDEIVTASEELKEEKMEERSKSVRSLAECISASEEEEWSALEGITRVNSLLNLPRFLSGHKRSTPRKWFS